MNFLRNCMSISVVTPAYNAMRYFGEAVDRVLAQTLSSYEVLVVDERQRHPEADSRQTDWGLQEQVGDP